MLIEFQVHGKPQPQGSAKAFIPKGWKRPIITSDNKTLKPWRQDVSQLAAQAMQGQETTTAPVSVAVTFCFARPKSVKASVVHKTTKPDVDKLLRSVLDSMTGIVFRDDSQVVCLVGQKEFGPVEGAVIRVRTI
jgi:crossover junction endodeoxyribonuclease RusA